MDKQELIDKLKSKIETWKGNKYIAAPLMAELRALEAGEEVPAPKVPVPKKKAPVKKKR